MLAPPVCYGLPDTFEEWRAGQSEAVEAVVDSTRRFIAQAAPTGFGKSLAYMGAAVQMGRTCILTRTKGLQDQLVRDFGSIGLTDIRGMNSYLCDAARNFGLSSKMMCNEGPCTLGANCKLRDGGCQYYDQLRRVMEADLVVTNYSYWMHSHKYGLGLGHFSLLVLDEAHEAPDELSGFVGVRLDTAELGAMLDDGRTPSPQDNTAAWRLWAKEQSTKCKFRLDLLALRIQELAARNLPLQAAYTSRAYRMGLLLRKLEGVRDMQGGWAIERQGRFVELNPVWPGPYAETTLFRSIPKVALFSATMHPKTANLLGIKNHDLHFTEHDSDFPKERRPIIHVDTVSVKHDTSDDEMQVWVNRIDQIIDSRLDRKGVVHVVSYARRDLLVHNSRHRRILVHHGSGDTAAAVEKYRRFAPPCVLVSPSVGTGWDFPYDQCEYQIIAKVPFPDFTSALARARDLSDNEWSKYLTMLGLVQSTGRGMRARDDRCETLIVDDNVTWFVRKFGKFAPKWWLEAYRSSRTIPSPLEKL